MKRKKVVYFLGAGASYPFGVPLTRDILPEILKGINRNNLFKKIDGYDFPAKKRKEVGVELLGFLMKLMPGLDEMYKDYKKDNRVKLPLITDILSIVDHITVNNNLPFYQSTESISYYRRLLDRAIFEILGANEDFTAKERKNLYAFLKLIKQHVKHGDLVSFITTNYDSTFEVKIYDRIKNVGKIDFGFSWRDTESEKELIHYQPETTQMRILKLHGSLNWLKCDLCDHIYINPYGNIIHHSFRNVVDDYNSCHCGNGPLKSIIVAPSFEREVKDPNLLHVWKSSVQALREADEWIIIGYSLPAEDLAIKSLLIRGKNSRKKPMDADNCKVIQFGDDAKPSFDLLFGSRNYSYFNKGLLSYLADQK